MVIHAPVPEGFYDLFDDDYFCEEYNDDCPEDSTDFFEGDEEQTSSTRSVSRKNTESVSADPTVFVFGSTISKRGEL